MGGDVSSIVENLTRDGDKPDFEAVLKKNDFEKMSED